MKDAQAQMAAVQVAIRIRPLTERDRAQPRNGEALRANDNHVQVVSQNKYFTYDHVFGPNTHQSEIFYSLGQGPVQKFTEGYNVTMLAYGQTSSGKTYTMGTAQHTQATDPEEDGIVPRAMELLFELLQQQYQQHNGQSPTSSSNGRSIRPISSQKPIYKYSVKVSFVEIYNEELIDLLNSAPPHEKPPVTIREDTKGHIYWTGVKEVTVNNTNDILYYLQQGTENRATGSTDMNEKSSRSHAIFSVTLKQEKWVPSSPHSSRAASPIPSKLNQPKHQARLSPASKTAPQSDDGDWIITNSKFHFVDLAGSERLKRTAAEGDRRKEGININAGLLALGNVISALGDPAKKSTHIPYRDSKLTRLLQDSLGGSAMTLMIACVSPAESNLSETLNTLQYANRARNIKNKVEKNELEEWMTTDNIDLLRNMISKLKSSAKTIHKPADLSDFSDDVSSPSSLNPDFDDDLYHDQRMIIADLKQQVEELQNAEQVARERNRVVENELIKLREEKGPSELDFQHLVEPVIEEYEKSISGLESQLAMIRAALSHSDQGFEEQQAKIEQSEALIQNQERTINELKRRNAKLLERRMKDETYISELEKKLMTAVEDSNHDREMLNELRGKILKLKEVDENTEQYIHDLEGRLTTSEMERAELKEKLSQLLALTKEEASDTQIEMSMATEASQKKLKELNDQLEASEKERQMLQSQIDQLLLDNESRQVPMKTSMDNDDNTLKKDKRIAELESELANMQHDYQEAVKELDDVLARYQEVLEAPTSEKSINAAEEEVHLLRQSVQHLERELDLASKREMIFRQMTEEHNASLEVEKTLQTLEGNGTSEPLLQRFESLSKKIEYMQAELQLQHIRLEHEEEETAIVHNTPEAMRAEFEIQLLSYKRELKTLTRILKEVKKTKANETKVISANNNLIDNVEHRMLIKTIVSIDRQLTEQYEKMKLEAKRFSNDMVELLPFSHENSSIIESEEQLDSPLPGSPHLMLKQPPGNSHSNRSSISLKVNSEDDKEKSRYLITRLTLAKQDLKMHRTMMNALEHKFKMTEISLNTFKKRNDNQSIVDVEIEELMSKMDAMKLQFENSSSNS